MATEYDIKSLRNKVFQAARDGQADKIVKLLLDQDNETVVKDVLNHHTNENGQNTTPLIIAARNGNEETVHVLLNIFCADVEQTGTVIFEKETIKGVTALWCAASAGYLDIVKMLIQSGAQINHATESNSIPLRPACFDGRLDIVEYLVDNGADIDMPNKDKFTCLMTACYQKHTDVIDYLVQKGTDLNCTDKWGSTALHHAAESGDVEIVKLLLRNGAKSKLNDDKLSPLTAAAVQAEADVVEYLILLPDCNRRDKIDALELLASSYAGIPYYEIEKSYNYLIRAMKERYKDKSDIIEKVIQHPAAAYDHWVERKTVHKLEAIKSDPNAILMECLTIRERLLVHTHPMVSDAIIYTGARFANEKKYDKCIKLWRHALELTQNTCTENVVCFPEMFAEMLDDDEEVNFKTAVEVFELIVNEVKSDMTLAVDPAKDTDLTRNSTEMKITACLYLVGIMLKIRKTEDELEEIHKAVYKFVKLNPTLSNGYTPLHMCCDRDTYIDYDHTLQDMVKFPNALLCKTFLTCGAKVDTLDKDNSSPLHLIIASSYKGTDFATLHEIVKCLCDNGAHADMYDIDNKVAMNNDDIDSLKNLLRSYSKISLSCIAARAIKGHKLKYRSSIPASLQNFIDLH